MAWAHQPRVWLVLVTACVPVRAASAMDVDYAVDGTVTGVAFVGTALLSLVPIEEGELWQSEILPVDRAVRDQFSTSAAALSDSLVIVTLVTPLAAQLGRGVNTQLGDTTLVYGQALGVNLLLNAGAKVLVRRPRPYAYHPDARVAAFAHEEGSDSRRSFYSGHASSAFAAAVAGSLLFAYGSDDSVARATLWGVELALASATAGLRVRAGKHFYSDVIVGALVGSAIGVAVPHLHRGSSRYHPEPVEWAAIAGGVVAGSLASLLLPMPSDVPITLSARSVRVVPLAVEHGSGLALAGRF